VLGSAQAVYQPLMTYTRTVPGSRLGPTLPTRSAAAPPPPWHVQARLQRALRALRETPWPRADTAGEGGVDDTGGEGNTGGEGGSGDTGGEGGFGLVGRDVQAQAEALVRLHLAVHEPALAACVPSCSGDDEQARETVARNVLKRLQATLAACAAHEALPTSGARDKGGAAPQRDRFSLSAACVKALSLLPSKAAMTGAAADTATNSEVLYIDLSVYVSVFLSIYLPICVSVYLSRPSPACLPYICIYIYIYVYI